MYVINYERITVLPIGKDAVGSGVPTATTCCL